MSYLSRIKPRRFAAGGSTRAADSVLPYDITFDRSFTPYPDEYLSYAFRPEHDWFAGRFNQIYPPPPAPTPFVPEIQPVSGDSRQPYQAPEGGDGGQGDSGGFGGFGDDSFPGDLEQAVSHSLADLNQALGITDVHQDMEQTGAPSTGYGKSFGVDKFGVTESQMPAPTKDLFSDFARIGMIRGIAPEPVTPSLPTVETTPTAPAPATRSTMTATEPALMDPMQNLTAEDLIGMEPVGSLGANMQRSNTSVTPGAPSLMAPTENLDIGGLLSMKSLSEIPGGLMGLAGVPSFSRSTTPGMNPTSITATEEEDLADPEDIDTGEFALSALSSLADLATQAQIEAAEAAYSGQHPGVGVPSGVPGLSQIGLAQEMRSRSEQAQQAQGQPESAPDSDDSDNDSDSGNDSGFGGGESSAGSSGGGGASGSGVGGPGDGGMAGTGDDRKAGGRVRYAGGGLADDAQRVRQAGRFGDTYLAHITPREAARLGPATRNPETGLPEHFLGDVFDGISDMFGDIADNDIFKSILPVAGGILGGALGGPFGAAAGAALGSLAGGGDIEDALLSGAISGIGTYAVPKLAGNLGIEGLGESVFGGGEAAASAGDAAAAGMLSEAPAATASADPSFLAKIANSFTSPAGLLALGGAGAAGAAGLFGGEDEQEATPGGVPPVSAGGFEQQPWRYGTTDPRTFRPPVGDLTTYGQDDAGEFQYFDDVNPPIRFDSGGPVWGPGDGQSDSIPAMLSQGEYVIPADVVSALGNGSNDAGARQLDTLRGRVRQHRAKGGTALPPKSKPISSYLSGI